MIDAAALERDAVDRGLTLLGGFDEGAGTTILLGPDPATFWSVLIAAPEWGGPDPVDRWSRRVIGGWAATLGAVARYPFGDPPEPFLRWATASRRCHISPVGMLVHDTQGLMVSFRGALTLPSRIT
ncbi:MAG: ferredoxin, partial [Jannaschia sp.]